MSRFTLEVLVRTDGYQVPDRYTVVELREDFPLFSWAKTTAVSVSRFRGGYNMSFADGSETWHPASNVRNVEVQS